MGFERHVPVVVHLVRAVIGRRARVIRRSLAWTWIHDLHMLLIVSLIVATAAVDVAAATVATAGSTEDTSTAASSTYTDAAGSLLVTATYTRTAVLALLVVVIGVLRMVLVMMVMVVMRTAEKVRRPHVVL